MVIGFFELTLSGIARFPQEISSALRSMDKNLEFVFFYDETDTDVDSIIDQLPKKSRLIRVSSVSHLTIKAHLSLFNIKILVVMAQRIPDMAMVSVAKELHIDSVMFQHGLYIPFMKRQPSMFLLKFHKTLRYLKYLSVISKSYKLCRLTLFYYLFSRMVFGRKPFIKNFDSSRLNVAHVLVYGDYWKIYHSREYSYSSQQQTIVGSPDFSKHIKTTDVIDESKICYVAQSLVEDGRLPRKHMLAFVKNLSNLCRLTGKKLVIKLHPRSDLSLYAALTNIAEFESKILPACGAYIGHYSSLLVSAAMISNKLYLIDFPGHQIPDYLDALSKCRSEFDNLKPIISEIDSDIGVNESKVSKNIKYAEYYFGPRNLDANQETAKFIYKRLK